LIELKNVYWLGYKGQASLPAYLRGADVLLLPYKLNEHTRHVFPLKFCEYLATGKPVVSTRLPALMEYEALIGMGDGEVAIVNLIESALQRPTAGAADRMAFAERNTWEDRFASINLVISERAGVTFR
jgi:glycosyltransferase involved in cell wall biosynthesis